MCTACLACAAVLSCLIDSYTDTLALSTGSQENILINHLFIKLMVIMLWIVQLWFIIESLCTKYAEGNNYCYRDRSMKKSATHFHQPEEQLDPFSDLHLSSFHLSNRRKIVSASGVP